MALDRVGQIGAEQAFRGHQRPPPGQLPQRATVCHLALGQGTDRCMARRLQRPPPPHEPRRAYHVRVSPTVERGPNPERRQPKRAESKARRTGRIIFGKRGNHWALRAPTDTDTDYRFVSSESTPTPAALNSSILRLSISISSKLAGY